MIGTIASFLSCQRRETLLMWKLEGNNIAVNSWKSVCCSYPEKTGYGHTDQIFMLRNIEWSVEYQEALHI